MSRYLVWDNKANALVNGPHATEEDAQAALARYAENRYNVGDLTPYLVIAEIPASE